MTAPTRPYQLSWETVFKTVAFVRSATLPTGRLASSIQDRADRDLLQRQTPQPRVDGGCGRPLDGTRVVPH
jgi:hypothetical protein